MLRTCTIPTHLVDNNNQSAGLTERWSFGAKSAPHVLLALATLLLAALLLVRLAHANMCHETAVAPPARLWPLKHIFIQLVKQTDILHAELF